MTMTKTTNSSTRLLKTCQLKRRPLIFSDLLLFCDIRDIRDTKILCPVFVYGSEAVSRFFIFIIIRVRGRIRSRAGIEKQICRRDIIDGAGRNDICFLFHGRIFLSDEFLPVHDIQSAPAHGRRVDTHALKGVNRFFTLHP